MAPTLYYRWKQKLKEGGIQNLQAMKRGPKAKDHETQKLERENARLTAALCESSISAGGIRRPRSERLCSQ